MIQTLTLPWPARALNPNAGVHRMALYRAKKAMKHACWAIAKGANLQLPAEGRIDVELFCYPPIKRARDEDNMIASMKAGLDGIAIAGRCNDSRFHVTCRFVEQQGGYIKAVITT